MFPFSGGVSCHLSWGAGWDDRQEENPFKLPSDDKIFAMRLGFTWKTILTYIYIYICICMYTHTWAPYIYIYTHTYMYYIIRIHIELIYIYLYTHIYVYMHMRTICNYVFLFKYSDGWIQPDREDLTETSPGERKKDREEQRNVSVWSINMFGRKCSWAAFVAFCGIWAVARPKPRLVDDLTIMKIDEHSIKIGRFLVGR